MVQIFALANIPDPVEEVLMMRHDWRVLQMTNLTCICCIVLLAALGTTIYFLRRF